ncbi:MAG: Nif3-like dinuclear metal center hexameric protein [Chitinophagaceae bacterium]|nr:Nif3-like dinuclear metal center hexameric protein [Chitinophagaceae bacterium]
MSSTGNSNSPYANWQRRNFIRTGLQATGALMVLPASGMTDGWFGLLKEYTVQDVIDIVLKEIPGAPIKDTVDTIKTGSAEQKVTGIVTTMFPTIDVIKEAIRLRANLIIPHEPVFYNHLDKQNWIENSEVVARKLELLNKHKIAIWRAHDYWHELHPDGIIHGVVKKAGWEKYYKEGKILNMPPASVKELAIHLKAKLGIRQVRVIGDLSQKCSKIALLPGAWGGWDQITTLVQDKPDILIVGEVDEWETAEYIRDARVLGMNISLIILGHVQSEEPGMEWMGGWLQPRVPGINVIHVGSKDPFVWI